MSSLKPILGHIFIDYELRFATRTSGAGIHLVEAKQQGIPREGIVVAIAPDVECCEVGDRVLFQDKNPVAFKRDGVKVFRVHHKQIYGVYND